MSTTILIVDDEKNTRDGLQSALEDHFDVYMARDAEEAFKLMDQEVFDVVLTDLRMAGKSGLSVIDACLKKAYAPICIMMTAYGNVETAVEAMKRGAFDFLPKPVNLEKLELLIKRGLGEKKLKSENKVLHQRLDEKYGFDGMIGHSPAFLKMIEQVRQVAPTKATVLITGETGTGKERIAQMLHQHSPRAKNNFVAVHCAALPTNLLESELFGHEKGAFTGASEKRLGRFELAQEGTLFLDEMGEIDASLQVKLLRFLETKSFERVGSNKPIQLDVRLVCATHKDLEGMVKSGSFREDLLYRLNVIQIKIPSLRDRPEDIELLLKHYLNYFSKENRLKSVQISPEVLKIVLKYEWPGNIRELKNFCENTAIMHSGKVLLPEHLQERFSKEAKDSSLSMEHQEKVLIKQALKEARGNKTQAAKLMGISRRTLYRKLEEDNT